MTSPNQLSLQTIIDQIDVVLQKSNSFLKSVRQDNDGADVYALDEAQKIITMMAATVDRLAPMKSHYRTELEITLQDRSDTVSLIKKMTGILKALRYDYDAGHMQSFQELIHTGLFGDFLEMAMYFLKQGFKDPAAVMTGGVLEAHLRNLCLKNGLPIEYAKPSVNEPKKASHLNSDLARQQVYSDLDQKNVTAWLDLRNKSAHAKYSEYTKEQVELMLQGVRDFLTRNPA